MSEMIERVAKALEDAQIGWGIHLTRLVDGVSTYTAQVSGQEAREFDDYDDASEWVQSLLRQHKARAAIAAMRELTETMVDAARTAGPVILVEREVGKPYPRTPLPEEVRAMHAAMIDTALQAAS